MNLPKEVKALRKQLQTAWKKGYAAREAGKDLSDNPYAITAMSRAYRKHWDEGWTYADGRATQKSP